MEALILITMNEQELKNKIAGAMGDGFGNLDNLRVGEELFFDNQESNTIDYSRPIKEYGTISDIVNHLRANWGHTENVSTKSLNKDGVLIQDNMSTYLSTDAYSSGMFKSALISPLKLAYTKSSEKDELEKFNNSKALVLGELLHQCLLEPTKFSRLIKEPKFARNSISSINVGIAFYEKLTTIEQREEATKTAKGSKEKIGGLNYLKIYLSELQALSGKDPIPAEYYIKAQILKTYIDSYDNGSGIIYRLLKNSKRECSIYYTCPESGLKMKIRPDSLQFKENIGVDAVISVKSTSTEDLRGFFHSAAKFHYDLSEGMYQHIASKATGRDFNTTIMIILQTVAPFSIGVGVWSGHDIEVGKYKFFEAKNIAETCIKNEHYPSYDAKAEFDDMGMFEIELPQWNNKPINNFNL